MSTFINLDLKNDELKHILGSDVRIETEDKSIGLTLTDEQFQKLHDDYREDIGELTISELQDEMIILKDKVEELENIIEQYEEC